MLILDENFRRHLEAFAFEFFIYCILAKKLLLLFFPPGQYWWICFREFCSLCVVCLTGLCKQT